MKKTNLILFSVLILNYTLNGQSVWTENFEGNWSANWNTLGTTWEVGTPTYGPDSAFAGDSCVATGLNGNYTDGVDEWFVRTTPFTVPPANQNPRLRFWHWHSFNYGDYGNVQVSTDGGINWTVISPDYGWSMCGVWNRPWIDLNAFAGTSIILSFYFHSEDVGSNGAEVDAGWYIDEVALDTGALTPFTPLEDWESGIDDWYSDYGIWEVGTPTNNYGPDSAYSGTQCAATKLSANYCDNRDSRLISPPFTVPPANQNPRLRFWHWHSFNYGDYGNVQVSTDGGINWTVVSPDYGWSMCGVWNRPWIDLNAFAGTSVILSFYFHSEDVGSNGAEVDAGWYIDEVALDTGALTPFTPLEDWESGIDDWYSDYGIWEVGTPTNNYGPDSAYSGTQCAATKLSANYCDNRDSRLISPPFTVPPANQNPRLRFWHWHSFNYGDYGNVQVSTDGGINWTVVSPDYGWSMCGVWNRPWIDLNAFAGTSVILSFYFHSEDVGSNGAEVDAGWYIDEVALDTGALTPFTPLEDWESGIDDWYSDYGIWEVGTPTNNYGPDSAYSGTQCAATKLSANYCDNRDSRLISPPFTVPPANQNPRLRFWHWHSFNYGDYGNVQVSTDGGINWTVVSPDYGWSMCGVWNRPWIDLNAFAGTSVILSFYFHSEDVGSNGAEVDAGWYIDEVALDTGALTPFTPLEDWESGIDDWYSNYGIWEVGTPTNNYGPDSAYSGTQCAATKLSANYCDNRDSRLISPPFTVPPANQNPRLRFWHWHSFNYGDYGNVQVSTDGGINWTVVSPDYGWSMCGVWNRPWIDLNAFAGTSVILSFYFHSEDVGSNGAEVDAGWYIDEVALDTGALTPFTPLEDWESGIDDWYSDYGIWEVGTPTNNYGPDSAYSGTQCAATKLSANYCDNRDSRLISPPFTVPPANQNPRLRFWHWHSFNYGDYGNVQVSTDGGINWTVVSPDYGWSMCGVWNRPWIDLNAFAGTSIILSFYFHSEDVGSNGAEVDAGWYIDEVALDTGALTPFTPLEDWESGIDDWYSDYGIWEVGTPTNNYGPDSAYSGTQCAATKLSANYCDNRDSRLISPPFTVPPANQNPRLRFWHWHSFNYGDYGNVQVSTDGGINWTVVSPDYGWSMCGVWNRPWIDLNAFAGTSVILSFYFHSEDVGSNGAEVDAGWYIDEVALDTGALTPFTPLEDWESGIDDWYSNYGIWEVGTPTNNYGPDSAYSGTQCAATKLSANYCDNRDSRLISPPFTVPPANQNPRLRFWHWHSFNYGDYGNVQVSTDGGINWTVVSPDYGWSMCGVWNRPWIDLNAFAGTSVILSFYFHSEDVGSNGAEVDAGWYIDEVALDTGALTPFTPLEDWESGIDDWYSDYGIWEVGIPTNNNGPDSAYSGTQCAATKLAANYCDNRDSRLISPPFLIPSASQNCIMEFWYWHRFNWGDYGEVQIKKTSDSTWQTMTVFSGITSSWQDTAVDLSDFASTEIQIAFYFHSEDVGSNGAEVDAGLYIDHISFTGPRIDRITPNKGENIGNVTLKIEGLGLDSIMHVKLVQGNDSIVAIAYYSGGSRIGYATFNLLGVNLGMYDVHFLWPFGLQDTLLQSFEVIPSIFGSGGWVSGAGGQACSLPDFDTDNFLSVNFLHPPFTRPNWVVAIEINYQNTSNVDIPAPVRQFVSIQGAPLSFTESGLVDNLTELTLEFSEINGPPGVLRAGASGSITVYSKAIAPLEFNLLE